LGVVRETLYSVTVVGREARKGRYCEFADTLFWEKIRYWSKSIRSFSEPVRYTREEGWVPETEMMPRFCIPRSNVVAARRFMVSNLGLTVKKVAFGMGQPTIFTYILA
jgi:hypothetical protein